MRGYFDYSRVPSVPRVSTGAPSGALPSRALEGRGSQPGETIEPRVVSGLPVDVVLVDVNSERSSPGALGLPGRDSFRLTIFVEDCILPGFREPELGDSDIGDVLESLIPSYRVVQSLIQLPTFRGRFVYHRPNTIGGSRNLGTTEDTLGKVFTWSKGLGMYIYPINTRSVRKKKEALGPLPVETHLPVINEFGALRGLKAPAREK